MFNRILAPLDGSKLGECSIGYIKEIASGCHVAKVVLLTVLEPVNAPGDWWTNREQIEEMSAEMRKKEQQMLAKAETYLAGIGANFKSAGIEVETVILNEKENNQEAELILDYAENNTIDLIVMSTHGRSGITRWAFGSVADKVVRHSKSPVLTVVPAGCRIS